MPHVRIYIEGGAPGRLENNDFRRNWKTFLLELHDLARDRGYHSLEIVRGNGRSETFKRFATHHKAWPDDLCALLVDAETNVGDNDSVWDVVRHREGDRWEKPNWATDDQLYLSVQSVETWLIADTDALAKYFGPGTFDRSKLPTDNLEGRTKDTQFKALASATRNCGRKSYKHGDANRVIGNVSPAKVKELPHGKRLFESMRTLIDRHKPNGIPVAS